MRIRYATLKDVEDIVEVHKSDITAWYKGRGDNKQESSYEDLTLFERYMHGGPWMSAGTCAIHMNNMLMAGHHPIVAEVSGKVVGEIEAFISEEHPTFRRYLAISVLYVHTEFQRKGVGTGLVEYVLKIAERNGCHCAFVRPEPDDFYRRLGFQHWYDGKSFTTDTRQSDFIYHVTEMPKASDYGLVIGMFMPIGRYVCSRKEWEENQIFTYHIPELTRCAFRRLKVTADSTQAYLILSQNTPSDTHLTARAWSDSKELEKIVEIILSEGARMEYNRVRLLVSGTDFERLRTQLIAIDVETEGYFVKWLRPLYGKM